LKDKSGKTSLDLTKGARESGRLFASRNYSDCFARSDLCAGDAGQRRLWLLKSIVLGNLVTRPTLVHTRFTYHRTWETGLEVAA
jgi:hypothetical protein